MREVEDLTLAEVGSKNVSEESKGNTKVDEEVLKDSGDSKTGMWIKKKDRGARMREMEDEDKRWEKESGGNPRWGEGRTAHLYRK